MFKVDVFVKNRHGEWIVSETRYPSEDTAKVIENTLRQNLYSQLLRSEIQDYRIMAYSEDQYTKIQ